MDCVSFLFYTGDSFSKPAARRVIESVSSVLSIRELPISNSHLTFLELLIFVYFNRFLVIMLILQIVATFSILLKKIYVKITALVMVVFPMLLDYFEMGLTKKISVNRWMIPSEIASWGGASILILIGMNVIAIVIQKKIAYHIFLKK